MVLSLVISRLVNEQVDEITRVLRGVRVGNFDVRANVTTNDELGDVAESVNAMLELLTDLLRTAEEDRAQLASAVETLVTTAGSVDVAERATLSAQEGDRAVNQTINAMDRIRNNDTGNRSPH